MTSRLNILVFCHAIFKVPACAAASESSGNDSEGVLQDDKYCNSQSSVNSLNEIDIDGSDGSGEDSEANSVTDNKSDTDSDEVDSHFVGDIE